MTTSEMVFDYLKQQGLCPDMKDEVIVFKYQMLTFIYHRDDEDEKFFRLSMPGIFDVTEDNRVPVLEAINEVNRQIKAVKAIVPTDDVWLSTEILMDSTPVLNDFIPRIMEHLMAARKRFYDIIG